MCWVEQRGLVVRLAEQDRGSSNKSSPHGLTQTSGWRSRRAPPPCCPHCQRQGTAGAARARAEAHTHTPSAFWRKGCTYQGQRQRDPMWISCGSVGSQAELGASSNRKEPRPRETHLVPAGDGRRPGQIVHVVTVVVKGPEGPPVLLCTGWTSCEQGQGPPRREGEDQTRVPALPFSHDIWLVLLPKPPGCHPGLQLVDDNCPVVRCRGHKPGNGAKKGVVGGFLQER